MTDSEVMRNEDEELKEVVTTAANHNGERNHDPDVALLAFLSGPGSLAAILGGLAEQLGLESENVVVEKFILIWLAIRSE